MSFGSSKGSKKGSAPSAEVKGKKGAGGRSSADPVARRSASKMAKLSLPVARITRLIKQGRYAPHVSKYYVLKLTGIVEYVTAELLDAAMGEAKNRKRQRVVPRDFMLAVRGDEEFSTLFKNVQISSAGVAPCIHHSLEVKKGGSKPRPKAPSKPKATADEGKAAKSKTNAKSSQKEKLSQAYGDKSGEEEEGEESDQGDEEDEDAEMADGQDDEEEEEEGEDDEGEEDEDEAPPAKSSKDGSQSY